MICILIKFTTSKQSMDIKSQEKDTRYKIGEGTTVRGTSSYEEYKQTKPQN